MLLGLIHESPDGRFPAWLVGVIVRCIQKRDFVFVNTHIPYEGEIANTDAFVPYDALDENLGKLPADKNAKIVLYCRSDRMSTIAAKALVKKGYTSLYNLVGGMVAWEGAGLPIIQKK